MAAAGLDLQTSAGDIYADSSFIVALFLDDANSVAAKRHVSRHPQEVLPFTPVHRLEVRNAIRLAVRRGDVNTDDRKAMLARLEASLRAGLFDLVPVKWTDALRRAEELSARHTETLGSRALDILHVAIALESGARRFLSFDAAQRELARAEGLEVLP